jgi:hypothetical protein
MTIGRFTRKQILLAPAVLWGSLVSYTDAGATARV